GRAHQDRAVHLRSTGDHVLDVVGVARAVHVGVVAAVGFVLDVRGRDRDAASLLFRRRVDRVVRLELATGTLGADLGRRGGRRGLAMVNVADGADVHVRLGALELTLGHWCSTSLTGFFWNWRPPLDDRPRDVYAPRGVAG